MKRKMVSIALCTVIATSCGTTVQNSAEQATKQHSLELPTPPVMLTDPIQKQTYVAQNYWNAMNWTDQSWIDDSIALEQAYANYLAILLPLPIDVATRIQQKWTDSTATNIPMMERFAELHEHYLYDPNSPARNEILYAATLQTIVANPKVDEIYKIRPENQLKLIRKNRVGSKAANFNYTTPSGQTKKLHDLQAKYTLLFFYNPDCPDCARNKTYIQSSPVLNKLTEDKQLKVVAIYPDENIDLWRKQLPEMPANWIVGYDKKQIISEKQIYDLRAIPCLYLLGQNKQVLLKDAPIEQIEGYLTND